MPRFLAILLSALSLILAGNAHARNVALVIANWQYQSAQQLSNPQNDAKMVSAALEKVGFDSVIVAENTSMGSLRSALRAFRDKANGAETALIYYAGHGIEGKGRNWLVPTDAALQNEADLPYEAIDLEYIMDALHGAQLRIAVLDACRNNPFANRWKGSTRAVSRGLAPVEVDDVLVIYAAAPGMVAYDGGNGNSPFARSLARRIVQPGLPVQMLGGMVRDDVLRETDGDQRPFISASITGQPVYLMGGPDDTSNGLLEATMPKEGSDDSRNADLQGWKAALSLDTVAGYRAYLDRNRDGAFAKLAQENIKQLLDPTAFGGELKNAWPGLVSFPSALPNRYAIAPGGPLPIDGVWKLSTNGKRMRFEKGRAFAIDGWNFAFVFRVLPDQVTMQDIFRVSPGVYQGNDLLLKASASLTVRPDGNLDVEIATKPNPTKFVMIRQALDDPDSLLRDSPATVQ